MPSNETSQNSLPTIPTPLVIVHDVLKAAIVVVIGSLNWDVRSVAVGAFVAVLDVALLAWALKGSHGSILPRMALHFLSVLFLFALLLLNVPAAPALVGFSALLLGLAGRACWLGIQQLQRHSSVETI